jgi:deoxyribose-phosphate aldolase
VDSLASYIDHTLLKPTCTHIEIEKICKEVKEYGFAAACVPPPFVGMAHRLGVRVATVIGFPFGYSVLSAKLEEIGRAIADGADELDVVHDLTMVRDGKWDELEEAMKAIAGMVRHGASRRGASPPGQKRLVKVIIESGVLSDGEIIRCCEIYGELDVDFLKTSTGYAEKGATVEAVKLMRANLEPSIRIKASGGIRTYAFARQLIEAGASRLGCSASVEIIKGAPADAGGY